MAAGERMAMKVFYGRHHVRVHRFLVRLLRSDTAAEDVIGDVFFDVWQQANRYEARASVTTWLLSIARFKALSQLRRRTTDALEPEAAEAIADDADDPEVTLQKADKAAVMRQCLDRLPPIHREVIDLVYYHEQSLDEVAQILGIPENTVKTRVFHARKRLSDLLAAAGIDRGWP
ncbi:sigma-70 family RNA polymerase sigma factor [Chelatococcus reniformis]|nr:sigma-70 family RNA polymerase sigma factor [Chelatococcus reniformis]